MLHSCKLASEGVAGGERRFNLTFMNYTYVLKSKKDSKFYVGWTNDLKKRILEHNSGNVLATKDRRPMELVYYEACKSKENAIRREKYFKTGYGRRFLESRI